jgi:hypothetical protein
LESTIIEESFHLVTLTAATLQTSVYDGSDSKRIEQKFRIRCNIFTKISNTGIRIILWAGFITTSLIIVLFIIVSII